MTLAIVARTLPFVLFMAFIGADELINWLSGFSLNLPVGMFHLYLYPIKTIVVAAVLIYFRKEYREISLQAICSTRILLFSIVAGIVVFILWINMDWAFATFGQSSGYNPTIMSDKFTAYILVGFRLIGATLLVPIMEELFWRSFVIRYIISADFQNIPMGSFTWTSFIISSALFGMEHNLWLAGIMAGVAYTLLLYRYKNLTACIVAHGVTNLLLGLYVLMSGNWEFW